MNPEQAHDLFHRALDIADPAERHGFLKGACGHDAELMAHVQKLLAAHAAAEGAFPTEPGDRTEFVHVSEGPGTQIGKYKLLQKLGEGGMGVVYMAEQREPFDKRVALKIIKLGMDTKAVVARFEAERQALALMNHPNIAKVLDAGATETGRPYFVMELVKGEPLTEYCDKHKLSTRQRLELFIPVCQAIQHAHQKGIIHRDIKPSNILVALFDGRPVPMVIDFGIAKATNQRLTQQTVFTNLGQLIGTPAYMSPEQAEGSQLDIDTRSDIYSLGVLLYELLTGSQPFPEKRLRSAGWAGMMKIIREEEPQRPSTRLSTLTEEEQSQLAGAHGGEPPRKIGLVLRRELDLVILKCLQKDRTQRYESANGLAMEIQRYLNGEPVAVVPPTLGYQFAKFARKHKQAVAMAAAFALVLAGATVFSAWQAHLATKAKIAAIKSEQLATRQVEKLAAINGWMNRDLLPQVNAWTGAQAEQQRGVDIKLKDAILQSAQRLSEDFKDHPEIEGEIRLTIGAALRALGMSKEAEDNLRRAIELLKATVGAKHTNTLSAQRNLGALLTQVAYGQTAERQKQLGVEARQLLEEAYAVCVETLGADHPLSIEAGVELGIHHITFSNLDAGEELLEKLKLTVGPFVLTNTNFPPNLQVSVAMHLCELRTVQGRHPEAHKMTKELVAFAQESSKYPERGGLSTLEVLRLNLPKAFWLWRWDRDIEQAERLILQGLATSRKLVNDGFPTEGYIVLARDLYFQQQDYEKSHRYAREVAELQVRAFGPDGGDWTIRTLKRAASIPAAMADWTGAAAELRRQRQDLSVVEGVTIAMEALATHMSGDLPAAGELRKQYFQLLQKSLVHWDGKGSYSHPADIASLKAMMAFPCSNEELLSLKQGIEEAIRLHGTEEWWTSTRSSEALEGILAYRMGKPEAAIQVLEPVLSALGGSHEAMVPLHYILAMAYRRSDKPEAAVSQLEKGEQILAEFVERGITGETVRPAELVAVALVLRDEAAKEIQPTVPLPPITKETLAPKRAQWTEIRNLVEAGDLLARRRKFEEAARTYDAAINHSAFRWKAAKEGLNEFAYRAFAVRWALGDCPGHIEILKLLHEGVGETETPHLYQLVELACALPPDLKVRRKKSQARLRLEKAWETGREMVSNEDSYVLGQTWYRDGKYAEAIEALRKPMQETTLRFPVSAKAFAAMAHWQLQTEEHRAEARRLLKEADERYNKTVIVPGEGMYPPWSLSACIMMEMVIKEADELIDPDRVNAPHVAALPPDGWVQ